MRPAILYDDMLALVGRWLQNEWPRMTMSGYVDEFAASPMLYLRKFGKWCRHWLHYDNNPFWISANTNKDDLECLSHLKVRLADVTLDVRLCCGFQTWQWGIERHYFQYDQFQDGGCGHFEKLQMTIFLQRIIRFTLYMYTDHNYTLLSDAVKTLGAYHEIRHYLAREGNESTCVIKRNNETADLDK